MDDGVAAGDLCLDGRAVGNIELHFFDAVDSHRQAAVGGDHVISLGNQGLAERTAQFSASPGDHDRLDVQHNGDSLRYSMNSTTAPSSV